MYDPAYDQIAKKSSVQLQTSPIMNSVTVTPGYISEECNELCVNNAVTSGSR